MFEFSSPGGAFLHNVMHFLSSWVSLQLSCRGVGTEANSIYQSPFQGPPTRAQFTWATVSAGLSQHASEEPQCPAGDQSLVMTFHRPWLGQTAGLPLSLPRSS